MPTSGTVSTTVFQTQKLIDHSFRRTKLSPQQITPEYLETAQDLLFLFLSTLASKGIALWCVDKVILPMYEAVQSVPAPIGTVDVLNCNLRTSSRLLGTASATEGTADYAFDGDISTSCTQATPAGSITMELSSPTQGTVFGILPNASGVWDITIQGSVDGTTWVNLFSDSELTVVDSEWFWVDIEGVIDYSFYRLKANNLTVLSVREFYVGTLLQEIPIAKINRDDYSNLPNKFFQGRPVQFYYDKQRSQPIITLWPVPRAEFTFNQIICYTQRYVEDVGTLTQEIEVPQRWYRAIMLQLASDLASEIPEVSPNAKAEISMDLPDALRTAWDSETDSSPSYILPNISCYTR